MRKDKKRGKKLVAKVQVTDPIYSTEKRTKHPWFWTLIPTVLGLLICVYIPEITNYVVALSAVLALLLKEIVESIYEDKTNKVKWLRIGFAIFAAGGVAFKSYKPIVNYYIQNFVPDINKSEEITRVDTVFVEKKSIDNSKDNPLIGIAGDEHNPYLKIDNDSASFTITLSSFSNVPTTVTTLNSYIFSELNIAKNAKPWTTEGQFREPTIITPERSIRYSSKGFLTGVRADTMIAFFKAIYSSVHNEKKYTIRKIYFAPAVDNFKPIDMDATREAPVIEYLKKQGIW